MKALVLRGICIHSLQTRNTAFCERKKNIAEAHLKYTLKFISYVVYLNLSNLYVTVLKNFYTLRLQNIDAIFQNYVTNA